MRQTEQHPDGSCSRSEIWRLSESLWSRKLRGEQLAMRVRSENFMEDWIVTKPGVLGGKPCIRGTRLSVEMILELLASGATKEEILAAYPQVTPEGLAGVRRRRSRGTVHCRG